MSTINLLFTTLYLAAAGGCVVLWYKRDKSSSSQINISNVSFNKLYTILLPIAVVILGGLLRLYKLGDIPMGLHQDEASIGYEAYILSTFGIDRNGYRFPVYPITYGSGGGSPLMIYLNVITTFLFGSGVTTLRALPAVLGILTLPLFFLTIQKLSSSSIKTSENVNSLQNINGEYIWIPLVSLCIITFSPYHLMLSRWSLDSNTTPFWIILSLFLFTQGMSLQKDFSSFENVGTLFQARDKKKRELLHSSDVKATLLFALSAVCYALSLYSYGATTIIIPIHLLIISIFCVKTGRMTPFQMILGIILFILFLLPLILFYAVSFFGLPQIITPAFTINALTSKRSVFASGSGFMLAIVKSIITMVKNLTVGNSSEQILNYIPGFAPLFSFTFPITIAGMVASFIRAKRGECLDVFMISLFIPSFVFGLFVEEDINRMVVLFIPVMYFLARGYIFVTSEFIMIEKATANKTLRTLMIACKSAAPAIFFVAAALFVSTYFEDYNRMTTDAFMPGYGEACNYANDAAADDKLIYSTYSHLSAPYMIALYYTKTSPYEFMETVHYRDDSSEFRIADSFGKFVFGLPEDFKDKSGFYLDDGNVFILHRDDLSENEITADGSKYKFSYFGNFVVVTN
ncbi:hypothetical protein [Butyrivibrio sp. WCD3002]|uniref:hypothetical protein n=1 Tax=Butyrivibrio sp. WCD3002 TaxID=1280676 RepID=UPI00040C0965|nr:hypothetical protein [Butyrivibrio sp. WCD3002]